MQTKKKKGVFKQLVDQLSETSEEISEFKHSINLPIKV